MERQTVLCGMPPDTSFHHSTAFRVTERCSTGTGTGCFITDWLHGSYPCDAVVDQGVAGQVTMTTLSNTLPMAGLQGTLAFHPGGLRITDLTPVGSAGTWQIVWEPTATGAEFVMFSTDGTWIPETDPVFPPSPVLRVTVAVAGDVPPSPITHLIATETATSTS